MSKLIDLNTFCSKEDPRAYLTQVFPIGLFAAASNGHIMAMRPGTDYGDFVKATEGVPPRTAEVILGWAHTVAGQVFIERRAFIDMVNHVEPVNCTECGGAGKTRREVCPECDGQGEVDAETDYNTYFDLECKMCDGHGWVRGHKSDPLSPCHPCHGTGKSYERGQHINLLGVRVQPQYWDLIKDLDGLEVCAVSELNYPGLKPCHLGFRQVLNGEVAAIGMIMGLRD